MQMNDLGKVIIWNTTRGIEAMKRAHEASTPECVAANEYTATMHRLTLEALAELSYWRDKTNDHPRSHS